MQTAEVGIEITPIIAAALIGETLDALRVAAQQPG
jgi:hypothetical protein